MSILGPCILLDKSPEPTPSHDYRITGKASSPGRLDVPEVSFSISRRGSVNIIEFIMLFSYRLNQFILNRWPPEVLSDGYIGKVGKQASLPAGSYRYVLNVDKPSSWSLK